MKAIITATLIAATLSFPALAQDRPVIRIATGGEGEPYNNLCQSVKERMERTADIQCIATGGSYQNSGLLADGAVEAAIVQANVPQFWEIENKRKVGFTPLSTTHDEAGHLLCDKQSGIDDLDDLVSMKGAKVAIGADDSGHQATWTQMAEVSPALAKVNTVAMGGFEAIAKILAGKDGITCLWMTTGVNGQTMKDANQRSGGKLALAETYDDELLKIKDAKGNAIGKELTIPGGTYSNLQFGTFSSTYDVIGFPAILAVSDKFLEKNPALASRLDRAVSQAAQQGN